MGTSKYEVSRAEGGPALLTAELPDAGSVAVGVWFATGSRHETAAENGAAHFVEHLVFKGTRKRTAAKISQAVEGVGGYLNAFTEEEHTCYYARAGGRHAATLVDVLMDMALQPLLSPGDIRKEREVIKEEIAMYDDQPAEKVRELLNAAQFPDHPLGRPVAGTADALDGIGRARLMRRLGRDYTVGSMAVVAAGCLSHEELKRLVAPWRSKFRPGPHPPSEPAPGPHGEPRFAFLKRKSEQTHLELGFRSASRHSPKRFAVRLLNVLFGENMSSRLFQVVREEHGLAYHIQSSATYWSDCGDLAVSAGVDHRHTLKTIRLILHEAARLVKRPPSAKELARARDYAIGQFELSLENTEHQMTHLGENWIALGRLAKPCDAKDALNRVTPAEICEAAAETFQPGRLTVAMVGPAEPPKSEILRLAGQLG
jgi:predicted Zn-dependent peptidase